MDLLKKRWNYNSADINIWFYNYLKMLPDFFIKKKVKLMFSFPTLLT